MQTVALIDYGSGNIRSAQRALEAAATAAGLARAVVVTDRAETAAAADRLVLPGVGAFADCRAGLDGLAGMIDALAEAVQVRGRPFLGICVGMQLLATRGLEHQETPGLGWIKGVVGHLDPAHREALPGQSGSGTASGSGAASGAGAAPAPDTGSTVQDGGGGAGLKFPHMGWNTLALERPAHPVLAGIADGAHAYFVHSYALDCADPADRLASAEHGRRFAAVVGRGPVVGTQFHPEKSQQVGLRLIANFLAWSP